MHVPFSREILALIDQHQYLALFVLLLLEESGLPLPVPGDGLMMFAGYRAATGHIGFLPAFVVMELGTLIGASFLRWLGCWGGRPLVFRFGRLVHLDQRRLDQAERWLRRHGMLAIVAGRLVPGLRIATSLVCGTLSVPYRRFLPPVAAGSSIYILFFMTLGAVFGRETRSLVRRLWPHPVYLLIAIILLLCIVGLLVLLRKRGVLKWDFD